jgi:hypothetical protein
MLNDLLKELENVQKNALKEVNKAMEKLEPKDKLFFEKYVNELKEGKPIDIDSFINKTKEYAGRN